jgi:hypothetical protein
MPACLNCNSNVCCTRYARRGVREPSPRIALIARFLGSRMVEVEGGCRHWVLDHQSDARRIEASPYVYILFSGTVAVRGFVLSLADRCILRMSRGTSCWVVVMGLRVRSSCHWRIVGRGGWWVGLWATDTGLLLLTIECTNAYVCACSAS